MFRISQSSLRSRLPMVAWLLLALAMLSALALAVSGPAYRLELMELSAAFTLFRYAAWAGLLVALLSLPVLGLALFLGQTPRSLVIALAALVVGAVCVGLPYSWLQQARSVPPIHDISTDTSNPPAFEAIAPRRADAPNPLAYPGEETAEQQAQAYPDIQPLHLSVNREYALEAAITVAEAMGWELVSVDPAVGRIEATDTTRWFGFKDDVVIRIRDDGDGIRVDIRSKSRVGRSDVGTNAQRIRTFLHRLQERVE